MFRSFIGIILISTTVCLTTKSKTCDDRPMCSWCEWSAWTNCRNVNGQGIKNRNRLVNRDIDWKSEEDIRTRCGLSDIEQTSQISCEDIEDNILLPKGKVGNDPFQDRKQSYGFLRTHRLKRSLYEECTETGTCSYEEVRESVGSSQVCNYMKNWKCGQCPYGKVCVVINTYGCSRLSYYQVQCKASCGQPASIPFSTYSSTGTTLQGDVVNYVCNVNAKMEGNPQTTCLSSGQWSHNDAKCIELYPLVDIKGTVTAELRSVTQTTRLGETSIDELIFNCEFPPPVNTTYVFDVHWYINDKKVPVISYTDMEADNLSTAILLEEHWKSNHQMNMFVYCSTQVRYNVGNTSSPQYWSDGFEAGLKTDKPYYSVRETETLQIYLHLTVPLGCIKTAGSTTYDSHRCTLNVMTATPNYQRNPTKYCDHKQDTSGMGLIFDDQNCGVYFSFPNSTSSVPLEVTGEIDGRYNSANRVAYIRLLTQHGFLDVWKNMKIPDIQVYIIDEESKKVKNKACTLFNDPHITPFEMENGFYDNFMFGEFVVYKHLLMPMQINAVFAKCYPFGHATCICAIVIRNDDGRFVINMCQENLEVYTPSSSNRFNRYIEKEFCDDQQMTVRQERGHYIVELPSGTKVIIRVGSKFINSFTIKASALDFDNLVGLCGPLDGKGFRYTLSDKSVAPNEEDFKSHYFVPESESLIAINWISPSLDLSSTSLQQYCVCRINGTQNVFPVDSSYMECELAQPVEKCSAKNINQTEVIYQTCQRTRRKRSLHRQDIYGRYDQYTQRHLSHGIQKRDVNIDDESVEKFTILPYNLSDYRPQITAWQNGWTETTAYSHCKNEFTATSVYSKCTTLVPGVNVSLFINACVRDIKVSGDDTWLADSLHAYKTACGVEASMEESLYAKNPSSANGKSLLDELLDNNCLNDCNGNGLCVEGECQCDPGYFEDDCSREATSKPNVAKESMTGLCDTSKRACNKVLIPGYGFNPDGIKCAFRTVEVCRLYQEA